jgi:hypothetical protein
MCSASVLTLVVDCPERSKVAKCPGFLNTTVWVIAEVKGPQGRYVIDVPLAIVRPCHSGAELLFQMRHKLVSGISKNAENVALGLGVPDGIPDGVADRTSQPHFRPHSRVSIVHALIQAESFAPLLVERSPRCGDALSTPLHPISIKLATLCTRLG